MAPKTIVALGWAGVVPIACLSLGALQGGELASAEALAALIAYSSLILVFLGGAQWGLEMGRHPNGSAAAPYLIGATTVLVSFVALLTPPRFGLTALTICFALQLIYDLFRVAQGMGPHWYGPLRAKLTAAVLLFLIATQFSSQAFIL